MIGNLLTEQTNPASEGIDRLPTADMLRILNEEDQKVALAVREALPRIAEAVDAVVAAFRKGGRLYYIGAGTSGRLGVLDASECSPTFSVPFEMVQGIIAGGEPALSRATEASEDDPEMGARDLLDRGLTAADVVVGIAASGRTPYVLGALEAARRLGAVTISVSCAPNSALSSAALIPIEVVTGPEVIAGSTRMKAGTATKLVLNMLTTGAMIRLGYVFNNLMVNVQPKNEKLRDRARRIVARALGVDAERAAGLFEASGQSVRTAIVMGKLGVGREDAEERLGAAGGVVAKALE
jgi:N-acetylmuramic acid 6-phosphate etherase